jgi:malonyl-CoA O-methyltransferase
MMQAVKTKQSIDKQLLQKRFKSAAYTYDTHALAQKYMAEVLVREAKQHIAVQQSSMLELGCGTGLLSREIAKKYSTQSYVANDLVCEVAERIFDIVKGGCAVDFNFMQGDAAQIQLNRQYDVIWSGAALQWIEKLDAFFGKMSQSLVQKGYFALSSFDVDNYLEIKSITGKGIEYKSMKDVMMYAGKYFKVLACKSWHQKLWFKNPVDILKHMRYTGVNGVSESRWGKKDLQNFMAAYENFKCDKGYHLTYHPFILILQKL